MTTATRKEDREVNPGLHWMAVGWAAVCPLVFIGAAVRAYRPSFGSAPEIALAVLPVGVLTATMIALLVPLRGGSTRTHLGAIAAALGGWAILMFDNSEWWFLTFILFAVCYAASPISGIGPWTGVGFAGIVALVWSVAWAESGEPSWLLPIPLATFLVGSVISLTIYRSEQINDAQAALIHELTATREALALAERTKGVLEERARFASEIHDTLTQGFASIVLVSRAAQRMNGAEEAWTSVEATALENLDAARRLVAAVRPPELVSASLPDAIGRQLDISLPEEVRSHFQVVGEPRSLSGTVEVTLLRAAQEALLNIKKHADAENVHVTLSYLDDVVALDVSDDGVGFVPGTSRADVADDQGPMAGGQGLKALADRARSLSGQLTIEAPVDSGSVVSLLLPTGAL